MLVGTSQTLQQKNTQHDTHKSPGKSSLSFILRCGRQMSVTYLCICHNHRLKTLQHPLYKAIRIKCFVYHRPTDPIFSGICRFSLFCTHFKLTLTLKSAVIPTTWNTFWSNNGSLQGSLGISYFLICQRFFSRFFFLTDRPTDRPTRPTSTRERANGISIHLIVFNWLIGNISSRILRCQS